jgi:rRNA small subunit pseudouridine methyltransferase Nep1
MAQLLSKLKIRANQTSEYLLKVIKNPITNHIPADSLKVGTSCKARLVDMHEFAANCPQNKPTVFVVGAVSVGDPGNIKYNIIFYL